MNWIICICRVLQNGLSLILSAQMRNHLHRCPRPFDASMRNARLSNSFWEYARKSFLFSLLALFPFDKAASAPIKSLLEMRQQHVVIQKWDLSCGAAALATLLDFQYGDHATEKEIALGLIQREEYLKNPMLVQYRQGFSLLDLKRYVDKHGYLGIGLGNLTIQDLIERAPLIVPLRLHGYNHFVVFRGIYGKRVLLADPAWGNRTMYLDEFQRAWIAFPGAGKVGFMVKQKDDKQIPNQLAPKASEFVINF